MKRAILWALAVGLMLSFSAAVQAQDTAPRSRPDRGAFIDENADGLSDRMSRMHRHGGRKGGEARERSLTEEQQAALSALVGELKEGEATPEEIRGSGRAGSFFAPTTKPFWTKRTVISRGSRSAPGSRSPKLLENSPISSSPPGSPRKRAPNKRNLRIWRFRLTRRNPGLDR